MDAVIDALQTALAAAEDEEGYEEIVDSIREFIVGITEDMAYIEEQRAEELEDEHRFVEGVDEYGFYNE